MTVMFPTPIYPGIDVDANLGHYINSVCGVAVALSFATLCLRFFSRWWTKIELGLDDYLIVIGAAFSWTFSILCIIQVQQNFYGQHIGKVDFQHIKEFLKACYILTILYLPSITFSKLSLLALYWRAFAESKGKWPVIMAGGANLLWMVIVSFLAAFSCNPVRGFWEIDIKSRCLKLSDLFISTEAFTIVLDVVVLVMPVYFIKSIKRSLSQRISISSTFLIGLIVTIISCVRLWRLICSSRRPGFDATCIYSPPAPLTFANIVHLKVNQVDAGVWGALELNIWVVVASIPALRPLFTKVLRNTGESRTTGYSRSHGNKSYGNTSSHGIKGRFGLPNSSTAISLHSRDGATFEDYNTLVYAKPQGAGNGGNGNLNTFELGEATDVEHGIRVDREVDVAVRDKIRQPRSQAD